MSNRVSRRFVLAGLAGLSAGSVAFAQPPQTSLRPQMRAADFRVRAATAPETMAARSGLSGDVSWAVADVKSGAQLEAFQGERALPPASVTKAVTALYALEHLGGDYRFATRIMMTGTLSNGVVSGDLILAGGGDPTLDTDGLAVIAAKLKAAGVREVRGRFRVHDGFLPYVRSIDEEQPDHVGYSPAVSGIALNFNRVHFEWKRGAKGYAVSMDARSEKYRPDVAIAVMRVAQRQLPVYTYKDDRGKDSWTVANMALGQGGSRWLPVRRPGDYAGDVFRTMARANGIVLKQAETVSDLPAGAVELVRQDSLPLREILRGMLRYSNNLTAEMVGMTASIRRTGRRPSSLKDSAQEMSLWAAQELGMANTSLVDHSGLGDASRMTARDLVGALVAVRRTDRLRPLLKAIPIRDEKGRVQKGHPIKVNAKTGTLNFVSGLGGFMTAADGTEMAFAIFAADEGTRARIKREDRERPEGAKGWNGRAKAFQQVLIARWGSLYGG
jgi:D-alanyl-D-alanine carboxypeptidase/D-alanyl-D-alanine-endopeptidase (penicillin-binding protein 4)